MSAELSVSGDEVEVEVAEGPSTPKRRRLSAPQRYGTPVDPDQVSSSSDDDGDEDPRVVTPVSLIILFSWY